MELFALLRMDIRFHFFIHQTTKEKKKRIPLSDFFFFLLDLQMFSLFLKGFLRYIIHAWSPFPQTQPFMMESKGENACMSKRRKEEKARKCILLQSSLIRKNGKANFAFFYGFDVFGDDVEKRGIKKVFAHFSVGSGHGYKWMARTRTLAIYHKRLFFPRRRRLPVFVQRYKDNFHFVEILWAYQMGEKKKGSGKCCSFPLNSILD